MKSKSTWDKGNFQANSRPKVNFFEKKRKWIFCCQSTYKLENKVTVLMKNQIITPSYQNYALKILRIEKIQLLACWYFLSS